MSRWQYKTETVSVGGNTQIVRQLTTGEVRKFAEVSKQNKTAENPAQKVDTLSMILKFGCHEPQASDDDVNDMPPELSEACVHAIMKLSGLGDDEKKDATASLNS